MITDKEYNEARELIKRYLKQERDYKQSVRHNLDNKVFDKNVYTPETTLWDCDLSTGLITILRNNGFSFNDKLNRFKNISKNDIAKFSGIGQKRISELERLLKTAGIELL